MNRSVITAVGIDVSKGKSMVAVRRPGGEIVLMPFQVQHNAGDLKSLAATLKRIGGDIRIVMEHTGMYWRPIALTLQQAGFYVSIVNAMLIHNFSDNSLRKVKTDKVDALKIANYALTFWSDLREYTPEDETLQMLKMQTRLYERTQATSVTLKNGLISLLDQTFPGINTLFSSNARTTKVHFKWVDFVRKFWHKDCVVKLSRQNFTETHLKWCRKTGYRFNNADAECIYHSAQNAVASIHYSHILSATLREYCLISTGAPLVAVSFDAYGLPQSSACAADRPGAPHAQEHAPFRSGRDGPGEHHPVLFQR